MADGKRGGVDEFTLSGNGTPEPIGNTNSGDKGGDGSGAGGIENAIDPAKARGDAATGEFTGGTNKDGTPTKKRGRKPGGGTSQKAENSPHIEGGDVEGTASILLAIHAFLAVQVPEMAMTENEAIDVAKSFARVERHYPGLQKVLSVKVKDHVAFFGTLGRVYGTRISAIRVRKASEKARDITPDPLNVATPGPGHPDFRHG